MCDLCPGNVIEQCMVYGRGERGLNNIYGGDYGLELLLRGFSFPLRQFLSLPIYMVKLDLFIKKKPILLNWSRNFSFVVLPYRQ